jgi:ADP-ribose pyrophosphatase YjhB (NUDIX family)
MFKYCPACASGKIQFQNNKKIFCPDCGFVYYHNVAAATACIVDNGNGLLFLVREKEPGRGCLDLPGGFIDPGEGAVEGLIRECKEELGWAPEENNIKLLASYPNIYPYKNIIYNTCDLFFYTETRGLSIKNLTLQIDEVSNASFILYDKIDLKKTAFPSVRNAVQKYLIMKGAL